MEDLKYPIGRFVANPSASPAEIQACVDRIAALPPQLSARLAGVDDAALARTYRPGGWTVRQVVHHLADSHINSYVRFRLALTEENPTVKTYEEGRWAELPDARSGPVADSLQLLTALHRRWTALLGALSVQEWQRTLRHPALGEITLAFNAQVYAWHGAHHLAHIERALAP